MCVAILQPEGTEISTEILKRCFMSNSDGCGFAFVKRTRTDRGGKLWTFKDLDFDNFLKNYREYYEKYGKYSPFLVHFRAASKGTVTTDNCHPFVIDENHVFIHNGTFYNTKDDPMKVKSDTSMFNETILQQLPKGWWGNPGVLSLLDDFIGISRVAIMNNKGDYHIFNELAGEWDTETGCWYSNDQYKPDKTEAWMSQYESNRRKEGARFSKSHMNNGVDKQLFDYMEDAYHGESRWDNWMGRYQKFDFHEREWINPTSWDWRQDKYNANEGAVNEAMKNLCKKVDDLDIVDLTEQADDYEGDCELTKDAIAMMAREANVTSEDETFIMWLENQHGAMTMYSFCRCSNCQQPDYTHNLKETSFDTGETYNVCGDCLAEFEESGLLAEGAGE